MANQANIKAVITAEDKASGVLKDFSGKVESAGSKIVGVAKLASKALLAGGVAAAGFGVLSVKAYTESENALAQLNAVLKSTKGAAGVTSEAAQELATSLQKVTKFGDETILQAESMLLTFTKVGKEIFPQATETILDMSQALGQDTKNSAIQLGKALNDPIRGVTALRRVGVTFTEDQQKMIQTLVDSGRTLDAQKLILKELQVEFGGSARAAGQTFSGQLEILKNTLNDVQESIGLVIVKGITPFAQKAAEFVNNVDWEDVITRTKNAITNFWQNTLVPFGREVAALSVRVFDILKPSFEALFNTLQAQVIPVLIRLWKEVIVPLAPIIGGVLVTSIVLAVDALNLLLKILTPVINFMLDNKPVVLALAAAFVTLKLTMNFNAIVASFVGRMTAVRTSLGLTTASVKGLYAAIKAHPFAILASAAVGAFSLIRSEARKTMSVIDQTNAAIDASTKSNEAALKRANEQYKAGKISKERFQAILRTAGGYASGGFTGRGSMFEIAGVVHKGEYVVPKQQVDQSTGLPKTQSSSNVSINVNVGVYAGTDIEKRKLAKDLYEALKDLAGSKNMTVSQLLGG